MNPADLRENVNSAIADFDFIPQHIYVTQKAFDKLEPLLSKGKEGESYYLVGATPIAVVVEEESNLVKRCKNAGIDASKLNEQIVLSLQRASRKTSAYSVFNPHHDL